MKLFPARFLTVLLCGCIASTTFADITTSNCAWTIEEGRQGRARCALSAGPECPNVVYSRRIGQGLGFGGIGPEDRLLLTTGWLQDNRVLLLHADGSTDLRLLLGYTDPNWSGFRGCTIDDDHIYLCNECSALDNMLLSSRSLDGTEIWTTTVPIGDVVPVHGRGLAVIGDFWSADQGLMKMFDEEGNLVSEGALNGYPDEAAFNADGVAVWAYHTWDPDSWGGYAEWFCASELNPQGVSIHRKYFGPYESYPMWSWYYTKVNELGNVFVSAQKKVAAFADVTLQTMLWEHELQGFAVWRDACGDPTGAWFIVHSEPEGDDDDIGELKLLRIAPDGTLSWDKSIGRPWGYSQYELICKCDAEGNVYYGFEGEVISLDPNGAERWRMTFPEESADVLALDSCGTLYVRGYTDHATLYALSDHKPYRSRVRVKLPQRLGTNAYAPGDELVALLQPYNFGEDEVADGYLAVILPNGAISFYTSSGFRASPTPWFPNVYLPNSFEIIDAPVSLGVIPEGAPEGTYTIIAGFTHPGTLAPVDELFPLSFQVVGGPD